MLSYFRKKFVNAAEAEIVTCVKRYVRIHPMPTQGLFNNECYNNCIQWIRDRPHDKLELVQVMCVEPDDSSPFLHYVVYNSRLDKYLEVSIGWRVSKYKYFYIKQVPESEHNRIGHYFWKDVDAWTKKYLSWFGRVILRIDRVV